MVGIAAAAGSWAGKPAWAQVIEGCVRTRLMRSQRMMMMMSDDGAETWIVDSSSLTGGKELAPWASSVLHPTRNEACIPRSGRPMTLCAAGCECTVRRPQESSHTLSWCGGRKGVAE
jgi:hypothetical protein